MSKDKQEIKGGSGVDEIQHLMGYKKCGSYEIRKCIMERVKRFMLLHRFEQILHGYPVIRNPGDDNWDLVDERRSTVLQRSQGQDYGR